MRWRYVGIATLILVAVGAIHFFSVTLPRLRDPLPHPPGYIARGAGTRPCDQVRWDWAVLYRGTIPNPGLEDNRWLDDFEIAHHLTVEPSDFFRQINDWCDSHPKNTLADAALYVMAQE